MANGTPERCSAINERWTSDRHPYVIGGATLPIRLQTFDSNAMQTPVPDTLSLLIDSQAAGQQTGGGPFVSCAEDPSICASRIVREEPSCRLVCYP